MELMAAMSAETRGNMSEGIRERIRNDVHAKIRLNTTSYSWVHETRGVGI
jgi:hypothetical protein